MAEFEGHSPHPSNQAPDRGWWATVAVTEPKSFDRSEGRPIRILEQWWVSEGDELKGLHHG